MGFRSQVTATATVCCPGVELHCIKLHEKAAVKTSTHYLKVPRTTQKSYLLVLLVLMLLSPTVPTLSKFAVTLFVVCSMSF